MVDPQGLGRRGEDAAAAYLQRCGMVVVQRNWRCRHGEIDIVARDGSTLVFCEVKTRRGTAFGVPVGAITRQKVARLRRLAALYLAEVGGHPGPVRIDAVGILWGRDDRLGVEHLRAVG